MAKIRGVKPEFWTDDGIVELSVPARLLFIGLWNYACDNGHLQDKPKQIKMRIFPGDDVNVAELLRELHEAGRIERCDGWLTVPNLGAHQKIDVRYFTTCDKQGCEDPPEKLSQRESRRAHAVQPSGEQRATDVHPLSARGDGDCDGDGEGDGDTSVKKRSTRATQLPAKWTPNDNHKNYAADNGIDVNHEANQFAAHHQAKGSTFKNWDAAFRTWLGNAVKWQQERGGGNVRHLPTRAEIGDTRDGMTFTARGWVATENAWMQS